MEDFFADHDDLTISSEALEQLEQMKLALSKHLPAQMPNAPPIVGCQACYNSCSGSCGGSCAGSCQASNF